jgi:hypothetical protein
MAEAPYRFGHHPGLAGEPTGPIWPRSGEARPDLARFSFFPCAISICYMNAANKIDLKMLSTSIFFDSKSTVIYTIFFSHWYYMCNF